MYATAIKIFVAISRKQLRARMLDFSFGAAPKDTLRTATRRDATRDGWDFVQSAWVISKANRNGAAEWASNRDRNAELPQTRA